MLATDKQIKYLCALADKVEKRMKKFRVVITSAKDVKLLNDKIATDSLFTVGETITNNPLHVGVNVVTDERIKDSMRELANKRGYCTKLGTCKREKRKRVKR